MTRSAVSLRSLWRVVLRSRVVDTNVSNKLVRFVRTVRTGPQTSGSRRKARSQSATGEKPAKWQGACSSDDSICHVRAANKPAKSPEVSQLRVTLYSRFRDRHCSLRVCMCDKQPRAVSLAWLTAIEAARCRFKDEGDTGCSVPRTDLLPIAIRLHSLVTGDRTRSSPRPADEQSTAKPPLARRFVSFDTLFSPVELLSLRCTGACQRHRVSSVCRTTRVTRTSRAITKSTSVHACITSI